MLPPAAVAGPEMGPSPRLLPTAAARLTQAR